MSSSIMGDDYKKPRISLCVISRKEDRDSLYEAIQSVRAYVSEIIVVDTSEGDEKLSNLGNYTSKFDKGTKSLESTYLPPTIVPFKWTGSFADARNFSFEQATNDIILWIDSDDIVENPENLAKLAKKIQDGTADWIYLDYHYFTDKDGTVTARHWKPRLIRKGSGKWVGDVHEDLTPLEAVIQTRDVDLGQDRIIIKHVTDEDHLLASADRNLAIQMAEIGRDKDETDPRTYQYTAMSLQSLGRYQESLHYYMLHIQKTGSPEDKYWSLTRSSFCLNRLNRFDESIDASISALKIKPDWNATYFTVSNAYMGKEDWPKVIEWTLSGLEKADPDTLQVVNESDTTITPYANLITAYLSLNKVQEAKEALDMLYRNAPKASITREAGKIVKEALELEGFVSSFLEVTNNIRKYDRTKAAKLFDLVPKELDDDIRIQRARGMTVPPKVWEKKSVAIYCGNTLEEWSYPSKFTGIGGSEEAVINMSEQLAKRGYKVTVFNRCGNMKGEYNGVEYVPYYHFSPRDTFDILIGWRNPSIFKAGLKARRKRLLWLHDIAYPTQFDKSVYESVDKVLFLSDWHRNNLPDCPDNKVYVTNNGIDPADFELLPTKRPNSLIWASSYDRGLLPFIKNILPLIKKEIPDVTLDVAYGWQNILKEMDSIPSLKALYEELSPILGDDSENYSSEGIRHHGRLPHLKLAKLMGSCMVYPYASEFGETNNITSQKCQAAGCYVITTSQAGGTASRVRYGDLVLGDGIYTDGKLQQLFAGKVIRNLKCDNKLEYVSKEVHRYTQEEIREAYSWSSTADKWVSDIL